MPLTLIFHFGETPENGGDSGQKMSDAVSKSYLALQANPCTPVDKSLLSWNC